MRRARVQTTHEDSATARVVAAALTADNTDEMDTEVENATLTTTVRRSSTGGLQATVDDYIVNLRVATQLATETGGRTAESGLQATDASLDTDTQTETDTDTQTETDTDTQTETDTDTQTETDNTQT